jgi:Mg2+ and Co2+ transporter CorA
LKQQQASVVEAREAVKQGEETLKQGRSIMLFTVITIVFLPLSFFTGIFGMNTTELIGSSSGNSWQYKDVFKFMSTKPFYSTPYLTV